MSIALVHDFLSQRGGAERVVLHLARVLRDPVIVTSLYAPEDTFAEFEEFPVLAARRTSGATARRFRAQVLAYPETFRSFDLSPFDMVVVSSSAFAHHVAHPRSAVYWHTPPRFLYDPVSYAPWAPPTALTLAANAVTRGLRRRDGQAARAHQLHAANSRRTAGRLRKTLRTGCPRAPSATRHLGSPLVPHPVHRARPGTGRLAALALQAGRPGHRRLPPGRASRSPSSAPAPTGPGSSARPTARSRSGRA